MAVPQGECPLPTIGTIVDDAMAAIERDNPGLKSVLPRATRGRVSTSSVSVSLSTWLATFDTTPSNCKLTMTDLAAQNAALREALKKVAADTAYPALAA